MSAINTAAAGNFDQVYSHLLTLKIPLLPPGKSTDPTYTDKIASLYVHPALESALHLLNCDLPSAHFLLRHMQAKPQLEGMFLHGILHRIEGDYDNARAWYRNVAESDVFRKCWSSKDKGLEFIDQVEALKKRHEGNQAELANRSLVEVKSVIEFCVEKFGKAKFENASTEWCQPQDERKQIGQDMVTGGKGNRKF